MDLHLLVVAIQEQGIMMDYVTMSTHVYCLNLFSCDQKNCCFLLSGMGKGSSTPEL